MNNPLVSIIVPVYNVQNSVARCLESICAQTWKNIEVILVNDGSRDESFSICEQFREKDPRIVLVDKSNSGVSETRNCGMSLSLRVSFAEVAKPLLEDGRFLQPHRSYVVNLAAAQLLTAGELQMCSGARIPIPRGRDGAVREAFRS